MLTIHTVPALSDNYFWLFSLEGDRRAYIFDPGDAAPVIEKLNDLSLELAGIIITHRHYDHVDGITPLLEAYPNRSIPVYGPKSPFIPQVTHIMQHGDELMLFEDLPQERDSLDGNSRNNNSHSNSHNNNAPNNKALKHYTFTVIATPGHTHEHLSYYSEQVAPTPILVCGDTLFSAGCGRVRDKRPDELHQSLQLISQLPDNTQIYCSHEYTLDNLRFAQTVEPDNIHLKHYKDAVALKRQQNIPSVPVTLAQEKVINPFLRVSQASIKHSVNTHAEQQYQTDEETFIALRLWKDQF